MNDWPKVRLGEILTERRETPDSNDLDSGRVKIVEKISFGTGQIQLRSNGSTKTGMILVRPGDLLISGINAAKGAIAIYDESASEDAAATIHYGAYIPNRENVDVRLLWWMLRSRFFQELLFEYVPGGIKTELKAKRLLPIPVPLPPIAEQKRIVMRIEELAAQIHKARTLRHQAIEESEALVDCKMNELMANSLKKSSWKHGAIPMFAEVNPSRVGKVNLTPVDLVSFVPMKAIDDIKGVIAWPEIRRYEEVAKGYTWFKNDDIIFARITPCMQNGKSAYAHNLVNGVGFGSTKFHVMRPGPDLLGEWLHALVRHKSFREDAAKYFKGTAGQQRVPQSFLEQKVISVPPMPEQRRIVAELDALQAEADRLKHQQASTATELDALLPAILDRAFKGGI